MSQSVPPFLIRPVNARVLAHVEPLSAHSDVADALIESVKPLGDVQLFCPEARQYRYLVASTNNVIFAVALGMRLVGFRLDSVFKSRALESGAAPYPDCGDEWVSFTLFRPDWPKPDLLFWARKAYGFARETP